MKYYVIVNSNTRFPLFQWNSDDFMFSNQLLLATNDLSSVRNGFQNIETLQVVDENENEVGYYIKYDSFSSINYIGQNYSFQLDDTVDEMIVSLTSISLETEVLRLNNRVIQLQEEIDELKNN